jgi:hypothetical protein
MRRRASVAHAHACPRSSIASDTRTVREAASVAFATARLLRPRAQAKLGSPTDADVSVCCSRLARLSRVTQRHFIVFSFRLIALVTYELLFICVSLKHMFKLMKHFRAFTTFSTSGVMENRHFISFTPNPSLLLKHCRLRKCANTIM